MIQVDVFDQVEMRVGTILEVSDNKKSRNPAYVLKIDFGETIGIKKSSGCQFAGQYIHSKQRAAALRAAAPLIICRQTGSHCIKTEKLS